MSQPIEALLRPPVEFSAALTNASLGLLAVSAPQVLLIPGGTGYVVGGYCFVRTAVLLRHCTKLVSYQRRLRVLPKYEINPKDIKASKQDLFLGQGFAWEARHTQRYADLSRPEYAGFDQRGALYRLARRVIDAVASTPVGFIAAPLNSQVILNPFPPRPYVEGKPELHGVGLYEKEAPVTLQQSERVAHTFVVGTTRVGKTRLLEVLATQDIHNGDVVIVFDPKGDGDLLARLYAEARKAGREDEFQVFHLGFPEHSVSYNPVGTYSRVTEVAGRITGALPSEGNAAAFREFAWRFVNVLSKALDDMGEPINYSKLLEHSSNIDDLVVRYLAHLAVECGLESWGETVDEYENSDRTMPYIYKGRDRRAWASVEVFKEAGLQSQTALSLIKTFEHDKAHFDKLVASLFPLLEKLTSGPAAKLLSPETHNADGDVLTWKRVIENGGIVYVGLDALSDSDVASAVGNSMFADLTSVAGSLYKDSQSGDAPQRKISLHADEFNELVGREFVPLVNKAGGAGFQLTAYTQTLSDIIARFDSPARAGQVIGNLGTLIMLRVKESATAELLTTRLKEVEINHMMLESGTTDSSSPDTDIHFVSNTRQRITSQRVPLIHTGDLDALPKGHAFALLAGRLYKLRLPLFSDEAELPSGIQVMVSSMRRQYDVANREDWANTTPLSWMDHE